MSGDDDDEFARRFGGHTEDSWRICTVCRTFEPFASLTDTCCFNERGIACIFPERPQRPRAATEPARARRPPQGSRSRSDSRNRNLNILAAAAVERAERAADNALTYAQIAEDASCRAHHAAEEARAAASHAAESVARAGTVAAAAAERRVGRVRMVPSDWGAVTVTTRNGTEWRVTRPSLTQAPA